jgi:hypothetical protein
LLRYGRDLRDHDCRANIYLFESSLPRRGSAETSTRRNNQVGISLKKKCLSKGRVECGSIPI